MSAVFHFVGYFTVSMVLETLNRSFNLSVTYYSITQSIFIQYLNITKFELI